MPADCYPLAPLQRGMLFHALSAPASTMYLEQHRLDLDGDIDLAAFRAAWRSACELHPALRTTFDTQQAEQPLQVVQPEVELPLVVEDWRNLPATEQAARESAERERGFDLSRAPLFQLRLARLGDRAWRLLFTHHHLILDGWSVGLVLRDVATAYTAARRGEPASLSTPPAYRDFVAWAGRQDLDRAREYWTGALAGFAEPTPLGITSTGTPDQAGHERIGHRLARELTDRLERFRAAHRLTVETLLTAAWAVVLGRYSGTDDVAFGLTTTGRAGARGVPDGAGAPPGLDRMVGLLINTLPVRVRLDEDRPVLPWLQQLQQELDRTRQLELTPLDRVQAWSGVAKGRRLFDSILVVEDFPVDVASLRFGELRVTGSTSVQQTNYPLTLLAFPGQRLMLEALFDAGLLDRRLVRQLLGHLEAVLDGLVSAPMLGDVEPMRPADHAELIRRGGPRAAVPCEQAGLAPVRFAAWARREPDRTAISCGERRLTYRQLSERVARLAHRLRTLGVGRGVLVGVYLPRGVDLVVAVLAVACAGGGYVPVDRRHPAARARAVLADASVAVLLTDRDATGDLGDLRVVCLDGPGDDGPGDDGPGDDGPGELPALRARPDDVAYVIYTSGSTGAPKGVVVEHAQLARLLAATQGWFEFGPDDVWTLFHSIAFDFSVWELWGALANGGRLVIVPDEIARDPAAFRRLLLAEGVTVLNQTPSSFRALLHADLEATTTPSPYRLRWLILGGEMLAVPSLRPWLERYGDVRPTMVNMYGITETTVHVTYRPITRTDLDTGVLSPIGEPIGDLAVRLVDPRGRLVPVGVPGEIHVGGAGVARGYLGRPELTAQRFLSVHGDTPSQRDGGIRWYRTGDQARWLPSGDLEYLGRLDDQVKIRGYRIEPGEIEGVLDGHPQVRESAVVAVDAGEHDRRQLVAYVVPTPDAGQLSWTQLRGWLSERVPDHLVPAGFVALDELPLTPNGKIDRAALPAPHPARPDQDGPVAPRTDTERILAELWAEVLDLEQVGITDNFFALGGDSILTIQVVARASRRGVSITPAQLFAHQTIAELVAVAAATGTTAEAEQGEVTGEVPTTPVRSWFQRLDLPHPEHWNLPVLLVARQPVRSERLTQALTALVAHHDLMRMRLVDDRARIAPVAEHGAVPVEEFELSPADSPRFDELVQQVQAGLDPARGPMLRAAVFRSAGDEPDRVLLAAHHLVVDAVSWQVLLEDLDTAYRQLGAGAAVVLPAKTTDVPRWARGLHELACSDRVAEQARWWLDRIPPRVPALPDCGDSGVEGEVAIALAALDEPTTTRLLGPAQHAYRTRPDELLLAAVAQAVSRWAGVPQLLVDVEGHGRDVAVPGVDVSRTVGWFTTLTPVLLDLPDVDPSGSPGPLIKAVKEQLRAMPDRGAPYGLARWLRNDGLARQLAELPPAQLSFNYLGRLDQGMPADAWCALAPQQVPAARHPANPRPYPIDVVAGVLDGQLHLYLGYCARRHAAPTMQRLVAGCVDALRGLVDHCTSPQAGGPTPSDFPLAQVDQHQLDRLVAAVGSDIQDLYPLTPLQRGLLFHTLASPGSGVYFEQFSIGLDGPVDVEAFERAWRALLDRHAVLRASIAWQGLTTPHLVVHEQVELPLIRYDWRDLTEDRKAARLTELLTRDRTTGFELTLAPLTRLHLVQLAEHRWHLVWSHHHVILDGWSVALLIQEIFDSYEAIRGGNFVPKPPPRPFRDYLGYLSSLDLSGAWAYWRRVLSGVTGPTPLDVDHPAVPAERRDADYARVHRRLPPGRSAAVREFARAHRLTLDAVLHGAWALLLAHRSGLDDVVFGVVSSGRPPALEGVEEMVGLFVNTLPARVRVDRDQPVVSWLSGLLRDEVQARQFEHTPLDQIRGWTSVPPDRPLFDSGRGLENYPMDGSRYRTGSVTVSQIETFEQSNYALTFVVVPDDELLLQVWYDARQFESETGDHIMQLAEALVLALVADPERTVGEVLQQVPAGPRTASAGAAAHGSGDGPVDVGADQAADLLRRLPLARDAVVTRAPGGRLAAYLVPDLAALDGSDDVDSTARELAEQHVAHWRVLYDQTIANSRPDDPTFNIAGWNSSYTGGPIPAEAMAEWRAHTLDRIRALNPVRVLEIGCGTGLLLFGLLGACERYLGTDFSPASLARVRDHLATLDAMTAQSGTPRTPRAEVTLLERTADDLTGLEPATFDVVVINSVVQYFPSAGYLQRVLDAAIRVTAPDGAIFLGDLRHHGLLEAFHVSVQLHRAVDLLPVHELHRRVARSLEHERELLVDPGYVAGFAASRPQIGGVELMPKRGRHDTELTRYRYDAVLRLGSPAAPADVTWYDWQVDMLSGGELEWLLEHADTDAVGITGIPNARVAADVEAARLLADAAGPGTAGELRLAAQTAVLGMDPEELYRLGDHRGWSVAVGLATTDSVNVLFRRGAALATGIGALHAAAPEDGVGDANPGTPAEGPLVNAPLRGRLADELERQAWEALRRHLPELAAGCRLVVIDEIPRTADGRVDDAALPVVAEPDDGAHLPAAGALPPRTADELRLARIWEQALRAKPVDVRASFFDLGGDSLLAIGVIDEISRVFGREIPLAVLLQQPTIEGLAAALRAEPRPWTPLVEITRGDGAPLFCVHPAGGNVLCYAELARLLAPQPCYALQARGVEGDDPPYDDLPTMAARYLADVRARQPTGPYQLAGWSMGGLVAYEMAQQLAAAGEQVGLLALIETPTPNVVEDLPDEAATLAHLLAERVAIDPAELRRMPAAARLQHVLTTAERAGLVPPGMEPGRARHLLEVYTTHLDATRRYQLRPYGGRTCLLRAAHTDAASADHGWSAVLTGQWETIEVPGDHETVLWPPHVQHLAEALRARLAIARPGGLQA